MNKRRFLQLSATLLLAGTCLWLLFLAVCPARAQDTAPLSPYSSWFPNDSDDTGSVARGDPGGDGDLDLSPSNSGLYGGPYQANQVFGNRGESLIQTPASDPFSLAWTSAEADVINVIGLKKFGSVAWGDYDGDGDLDLVAATYQRNAARLYRNDGGMLTSSAVLTFRGFEDWPQSVAWGDVDGDGDLDLAVGNDYSYNHHRAYNRVYRNDTEPGVLTPTFTLVWSSQNESNDRTYSVAWGDVDGDGDLDLAVGNYGRPNRVYLNYTEENPDVADADRLVLAWSSWNEGYDVTTSVAWGDVDGDGDLDLAVGNAWQANKVYLNQGLNADGELQMTVQDLGDSDWTYSVAWGDLDSDGDLDLAVGNYGQPNRVYRNDGRRLTTSAVWSSGEPDSTNSIALGDYDGDGDLDLLVGNKAHPNRLYRNDSVPGALTPTLTLAWSASGVAMTTDVAWGDMDGDGDLDLAVRNNGPSLVYRNTLGTPLSPDPVWSSQEQESDWTSSVAWGDVDGDGDLDLAVGNASGQPNRVYHNDSMPGELAPRLTLTDWRGGSDTSSSIAWGDLDGDGDLDLAVGNYGQPNRVYRNDDDALTTSAVWSSGEVYNTVSTALGDYDGDGDLDLVAGNHNQRNRVYLNYTEENPDVADADRLVLAWPFGSTEATKDVTWGDYDGDGDLDCAEGGWFEPIRLYRNDGVIGGEPQMPEVWSWGGPAVGSLAWGDVDGDGDLDLAVGTHYAYPNWLFRNDNGMLTADPVWQSAEGAETESLAWGDMDGDGDLDLAVGNSCEYFTRVCSPNRLYRNDGGKLTTSAAWSSAESEPTYSVAWGDVDGDGDLDLVAGNGCLKYDPDTCYPDRLYRNNRDRLALPGSVPVVRVTRPAPPGNADFFSAPNVWSGAIPIAYTLVHPQRTPVRFIHADYSPDGGGRWRPAVAASGTSTTDLSATPTGESYVFMWDTFASGFFGQSDNVVVRIEAVPGITNALHGVPGPYLYGSYASQTFPFRVRGTQVQVFSGTVASGNEVAGAMVYRLPKDETTGGTLMVDYAGNAFRTDQHGYLQGRGVITAGDQLLALAPVPLPPEYTERYGDDMRLYYTNGTPTEDGLETWISSSETPTVTQPGVQQLVVSRDHPLLLFDLDVSLEWDAHNEPTYLDQLEFDLKKASKHLYDFTDGQVALGHVTVYQNADNWAFTHVDVHATNRLRPFATIGGMVLTDTIDQGDPDIGYYSIGQVNMGSTWNRYGSPGQSLGEDWPLTLAHELSHFLFFLEDTYLGLDGDDLLIAVDSCTGSAMGDTYAVDNTEFVTPPAWLPKCEDTLAQKVLHRSEWETIELWYPWLKTPDTSNSGPNVMPFELTTVERRDPMAPTNALEDPTFYLDYHGDEVSSSGARAFLLRNGDDNADDFEYVYHLGSPVGGQNRLLARGAQLEDRLCVFDQARRQYGCVDIEPGGERLALKEGWTPVIQISPFYSTTFTIQVSAVLELTVPLKARLYPEFGVGFTPKELTPVGSGVYTGTLELDYPSLVGDVQVWAGEGPEPAETDPQVIVPYSIGGNPSNDRSGGSNDRSGGSNDRSGGSNDRSGGSNDRSGGAPAVSPDGQMIFFSADPIPLDEGQFYTVQDMAGLPPLPQGKTAIGQGYNLFATPGTPLAGSISFQYLGIDALTEGLNEKGERGLTIHYWNDEQGWQALVTKTDNKYNLASARSQGPGVYALLAGVTKPLITACSPSVVAKGVTATLTITGGNFLAPVVVRLVGSHTYTLPAHIVNTAAITAEIPAYYLPAQEYKLKVVNGDQGEADTPCTLGVFDPEPEDACFYDFFGSGANKWQRDGDWGIVTILPSGEQAMTDSPIGPYKNAGDYGSGVITYTTYTTSMTTEAFDLTGCADPVLAFRHDYVIAQGPTHQDVARVEISADGGATWGELASYSGGGLFGEGPGAQVESPEWADVKWKNVWIRLDAYTGTVRLRFSLEVDQNVSDKGWVIDKVMAQSGHHVFLPLILRNE